jgi:hypothetical protein
MGQDTGASPKDAFQMDDHSPALLERMNQTILPAPQTSPLPHSRKPCQNCTRIEIGEPFRAASRARVFFGLFFVYAPIVFLPFFVVSALLVYAHLRFMGAQNLKTLRDFLPDWKSHRYSYKTQIVTKDGPWLAFWSRARAFWMFNCTFYCPVSVAVLEWNAYLVKAVENFWCPFHHSKKPDYSSSSLDYSFWHMSRDVQQLHPSDRDNPIWNSETKPPKLT